MLSINLRCKIGGFVIVRHVCLLKEFVDASLEVHLKVSKRARISNNCKHVPAECISISVVLPWPTYNFNVKSHWLILLLSSQDYRFQLFNFFC